LKRDGASECGCVREPDVIDAITARRWPDRADLELTEHVAACAVCADVANIVAAIQDEAHLSWEEAAQLPSAEVIWWRAQARARTEATRLAGRPIAIVQALWVACGVGIIAATVGTIGWWLRLRVDWLTNAVTAAASSWGPAASRLLSAPGGVQNDLLSLMFQGALFGAAFCLLLAPVTLYVILAESGPSKARPGPTVSHGQ
jgi:hypothetical protein